MDYTRLSLRDVSAGLEEIARDAESTFGALSAAQLNWKPDASRWSVGQCFEHLLMANQLMQRQADAALADGAPRTIWQRLPGWPRLLGRLMVSSQSPAARGKFKTSPIATPAASDVAPDIIHRFAAQQRDLARRVAALDDARAARVIMTSPFVNVVTYSLLDAYRLVVAHDRRHFEQARRVTETAGFTV